MDQHLTVKMSRLWVTDLCDNLLFRAIRVLTWSILVDNLLRLGIIGGHMVKDEVLCQL